MVFVTVDEPKERRGMRESYISLRQIVVPNNPSQTKWEECHLSIYLFKLVCPHIRFCAISVVLNIKKPMKQGYPQLVRMDNEKKIDH
jgi:hypothetical protein